jgi:type II secretory pathway predicted ATPase ExeA
MYYNHFGLSGPPFQLTSSPAALYMSKEHREAYAALEWGLLHESSGFTVLVGEVGTGKTTLALAILARNYQNVRTVYLSNPKLSFDEMMKLVLKQVGLKSRRSRLADLEAFNDFLVELPPGERVAIIIDEAHDLSDETMERLRLLSNSGKPDEKQLHFVFVGQPELLRRLSSPGLRQLDQRIGARSVLNPMQPAEVREYADKRLQACGGSAKQVFGASAMRQIVRHSGGIPRRINVLCHNAMLLAYSAGARQVDSRMVQAAVTEYDGLFSLKRTAQAGAGAGAFRRWLSRALESIGLRLLGWSRALNPREARAFEGGSPAPSMDLSAADTIENPQTLVS